MSLVRGRCTSNVARLCRMFSGRTGVAIPSNPAAVLAGRTPASVESEAAKTKEQANVGIPDINSTDIGAIQDPHTHDPKKWQKFAWKYLGALVTFGVAYKMLHWYVAKVEKEGKQRREDMEVNKMAKHETAADRAARRERDAASAAAVLANAQRPMGQPESASMTSSAQGDGAEPVLDSASPDPQDMSFQVFKPVQNDDNFISQEDSLKLLEVELEAKLKKLRIQKTRSRETDAEKKRIKEELRDLRAELISFSAGKVLPSSEMQGAQESSGTAPGDNTSTD